MPKLHKLFSKLNPLPWLVRQTMPLRSGLVYPEQSFTSPDTDVVIVWDHKACKYSYAIVVRRREVNVGDIVHIEYSTDSDSPRSLAYKAAVNAARVMDEREQVDVYTAMVDSPHSCGGACAHID